MSSAIASLESNLRAELSRQNSLLLVIEEQKEAIVARDSARLEKALSVLTRLAEEGGKLEEERHAVLEPLARALGLHGANLTLRDYLRRIGGAAPALAELHAELREVSKRVSAMNRNLALLARHYKEAYAAALEAVLEAAGVAAQADPRGQETGFVLNAEG